MSVSKDADKLNDSAVNLIGGTTAPGLDAELSKLMNSIPGCMMACLVDMELGLQLGCRMVGTSSYVDLMTLTTCEIVGGKAMAELQEIWAKQSQQPVGQAGFQTITVQGDSGIHVFMRGRRHPNYVLVLVCRSLVSLGLALSRAQMALPAIEMAV